MSKGKAIFILIALFACVVVSQVADNDDDNNFMSEAEVNRINSEQRTWEAGIVDKFKNVSFAKLKNRVGRNPPNALKGRIRETDEEIANTVVIGDADETVQGRLLQQTASTSFDARTKWPGCVGPVRNQKQCGACWAFTTVEAFEDRLCVAKKVSPMVQRSAQYLLDCAPRQLGCNGGYPIYAWQYLVSNGAPSEACYPYAEYKKSCPSRCSNGAALNNVKAQRVVSYSSIAAVKNDLQTYGSVGTWMAVYQDLYYYRSGVYQPTTNQLVGYHAVKIVGWGYDNYYGNYWIVQNSWGASWGEKGFFRIRQGTSQIDILDHFVAGYV